MTMTITENPSAAVAAEVRAEIARQGMSRRQFAMKMGVTHTWLYARIGPKCTVPITFEVIFQMAEALDVPVEGLVKPLYAIADSNREPADREHSALTSRDAWELAA